MSDKYDGVLESIAASVSGFIGASIVDLESGMPLATKASRDFDLDTSSAYNGELVSGALSSVTSVAERAHDCSHGERRDSPRRQAAAWRGRASAPPA